MKNLVKGMLSITTLAMSVVAIPQAQASTWSDTYIGYRFGTEFTEPNNTNHIKKHTLQFTHNSGYAYGQNFLNVDFQQSDNMDPANGEASGEGDGATSVYLTYRHQLHLGKVFDTDLSFGPVKEVALTAGFDFNTKNSAFAPSKQLLVVGPTLKFGLPKGFADLSLLYAYERNHCGLTPCGFSGNHNNLSFDPYYVVSAVWGIPFETGPLPLKFQGFANYNGEKGKDFFNEETKSEILLRSSLMLDVGKLAFDKQNTLWVGVGYEYWHNKFGHHDKPGTNTTAPTLQMEWHF